MWYILKQLFTPASVEVVDITSQLCGSVNVYRVYPHFVENLSISFTIYQISPSHALEVFDANLFVPLKM